MIKSYVYISPEKPKEVLKNVVAAVVNKQEGRGVVLIPQHVVKTILIYFATMVTEELHHEQEPGLMWKVMESGGC